MRPAASLYSDQRRLVLCKELGHLGVLEFAPLYFACLGVHDVDLKPFLAISMPMRGSCAEDFMAGPAGWSG